MFARCVCILHYEIGNISAHATERRTSTRKRAHEYKKGLTFIGRSRKFYYTCQSFCRLCFMGGSGVYKACCAAREDFATMALVESQDKNSPVLLDLGPRPPSGPTSPMILELGPWRGLGAGGGPAWPCRPYPFRRAGVTAPSSLHTGDWISSPC